MIMWPLGFRLQEQEYPSFIAQNSGNSVISATITVIPELNGCIGTSETFSISTIDPIPIVDDPADQVHCEGDNTNDVIFSGPNPTTSFIWTNDNTSIGLAASGSGDILSFIADNTSLVDQDAIITVTPEYNGCLGVPQTFTITVKPQPNALQHRKIKSIVRVRIRMKFSLQVT